MYTVYCYMCVTFDWFLQSLINQKWEGRKYTIDQVLLN